MEQMVKHTEDEVSSGLQIGVAGEGKMGRWASADCDGWGTGAASWAERASQGPWIRGRAWEGESVQAVGIWAAPFLGGKGGAAGQGSGSLEERGATVDLDTQPSTAMSPLMWAFHLQASFFFHKWGYSCGSTERVQGHRVQECAMASACLWTPHHPSSCHTPHAHTCSLQVCDNQRMACHILISLDLETEAYRSSATCPMLCSQKAQGQDWSPILEPTPVTVAL